MSFYTILVAVVAFGVVFLLARRPAAVTRNRRSPKRIDRRGAGESSAMVAGTGDAARDRRDNDHDGGGASDGGGSSDGGGGGGGGGD